MILLRLVVVLAGLAGACGVVLAAVAAHGADAASLASGANMLLVHAPAALAIAALADRAVLPRRASLLVALALLLGAGLFAGDLAMRHFTGNRLFPMAAPTGGTLTILSWAALVVAALWPRRVQ